jgi:hypothetical protein
MVAVDDTKFMGKDGVFTAPVVDNSHQHMAECLASVLAKALGLRGYTQVLVKGYPGFVNAMGEQKTLTVEASSDASKEKKQAKSQVQQDCDGEIRRGEVCQKRMACKYPSSIPSF